MCVCVVVCVCFCVCVCVRENLGREGLRAGGGAGEVNSGEAEGVEWRRLMQRRESEGKREIEREGEGGRE